MPRIVKNTMLDYIPYEINVEKSVNPNRIFACNNVELKKGQIVYFQNRENRFVDNWALIYAKYKAKKLKTDLVIVSEKENFPTDIALLIKDFSPLDNTKLETNKYKIVEVDSHNIVPIRFLSDKQEYNAASIRRKIYPKMAEFLTEFPDFYTANPIITDFVENKLSDYSKFKNNPNYDVTSGFSKYFKTGEISVQRVALEVLKADISKDNKEQFFEELIIQSELAENFCLYCKNYKTLNCISNWAKETLKEHEKDFRAYLYSEKEFENAKTHDNLWNAAQIQLKNEGKIHGYVRMYWAKKILEWSVSPEIALNTAICLNDKYADDAPSPNGYVGILWSIGGLHDRAFGERPVIGKIRPMTYKGSMQKFDVKKYISNYLTS